MMTLAVTERPFKVDLKRRAAIAFSRATEDTGVSLASVARLSDTSETKVQQWAKCPAGIDESGPSLQALPVWILMHPLAIPEATCDRIIADVYRARDEADRRPCSDSDEVKRSLIELCAATITSCVDSIGRGASVGAEMRRSIEALVDVANRALSQGSRLRVVRGGSGKQPALPGVR